MQIKDILRQKKKAVYTCRKDWNVMECVRLMNKEKVGALVVVDQTMQVEGIVTERDILHMIDVNNGVPGDTKVADIMTQKTKLITTTTDMPIEEVMEKMTNRRIRHMPVMENNKLIGIVSIGDVVKLMLDWALVENKSMKDYIGGV